MFALLARSSAIGGATPSYCSPLPYRTGDRRGWRDRHGISHGTGAGLRRVEPEHRRIEPGQVWLNLIPVFNFVWAAVTVERIAESLRNEFMARSLHGPEEWYGRKYGITTLALAASGVFVVTLYVVIPLGLIYSIAYWRQMNRYAERLKPGA